MIKTISVILRTLILLTGIAAITFLLWEPHLEGRNAHATLFEIYFTDPFLAYVYLASIPFFIGLYHAFRLFMHFGKITASPGKATEPLRIIKQCAISIIGFATVGILIILMGESDDHAGGVFMGTIVIFVAGLVAIAASLTQRKMKQ